ncbi:MAG: SAM-dependent methyltransferase [Bacteroidota bacterium]
MSFAHFISGRNRERKMQIFLRYLNPSEFDTILDVGYSNKEHSPNDNYLEKNYKYKNKITALGIDDTNEFNFRYPEVKTIKYAGGRFPFKDKMFNICWSNAVIEHVGNSDEQIMLVKEMVRTCKRVCFTTPNRLFPIEVHTRIPLLHLLPKKVFDKLLLVIGKSWAAGSYMNLLTYKQINEILVKLKIAKYKIIRNRLFFFTLDFIVIIEEDSTFINH